MARSGAHAHAPGRPLEERWKAWIAGGAVCSENGIGGAFYPLGVVPKRAGGVMVIVNDDDLAEINAAETAKTMPHYDTEAVIHVAVAALRLLIAQDRAAQA